jgi:hypothetical protein
MGEVRMRLIILACVLASAALFSGCDSSSKESKSTAVDTPAKARLPRQDLMSSNGDLLPLSAYYGVCTKGENVLRMSIDEGMLGYPTITEMTGSAGKLKVRVGKFGVWPGTVLKDVPATSPPRRIQIGRENGNGFIFVSEFEGAGPNMVSVDYDETDPSAEADALRFANNVVACHLSAVPAKANGK